MIAFLTYALFYFCDVCETHDACDACVTHVNVTSMQKQCTNFRQPVSLISMRWHHSLHSHMLLPSIINHCDRGRSTLSDFEVVAVGAAAAKELHIPVTDLRFALTIITMSAAQYDAIHEAYINERHSKKDRIEKVTIRQVVAPHITGAKVLDLACGAGYYTFDLMDWGAGSVVGVDISSDMIAKAKQAADYERNANFVHRR